MKHSGTICFVGNLLRTREIKLFLMACAIDCINEKLLSYFDAQSALHLGMGVYSAFIVCVLLFPAEKPWHYFMDGGKRWERLRCNQFSCQITS